MPTDGTEVVTLRTCVRWVAVTHNYRSPSAREFRRDETARNGDSIVRSCQDGSGGFPEGSEQR